MKFSDIELCMLAIERKIGVCCNCTWGTDFKQILCDGLSVEFDAFFGGFFIIIIYLLKTQLKLTMVM